MAYYKKQLDGVISAKKEGVLKHSYLISGPEGTGKLQFAYEVAKVAVCKENEACGKCRDCQEIEKNLSPDLHVVESENVIKIEQIRELQKALNLKPYRSDKKIAIIPNIERITVEAANCLLKTLEEPSGEALLILTASNSSKLLPTVKSRCQEIRLGLAGVEELSQKLVADFEISETEAKKIATFVAGRPALAAELADKAVFEAALSDLKEIINGSITVRFLKVKGLAESGDILKTLNFWEMYFRNLLLLKTGNLEETVAMPEIGSFQTSQIMDILDNLQKTKEYIESKINVRLALENLVLNI